MSTLTEQLAGAVWGHLVGLAGIRWGIGGIPTEWLDGMRGRGIVEPLVDKLLAGASSGSAAARESVRGINSAS